MGDSNAGCSVRKVSVTSFSLVFSSQWAVHGGARKDLPVKDASFATRGTKLFDKITYQLFKEKLVQNAQKNIIFYKSAILDAAILIPLWFTAV